MTRAPAGPIRPRPIAAENPPSSSPTAPPRPDPAGQATAPSGPGTIASAEDSAGRPSTRNSSRMPSRSGRAVATRYAQASSATTGTAAPAPKYCTSTSATIAPPVPSRFVAGREVAVFIEGSCGL